MNLEERADTRDAVQHSRLAPNAATPVTAAHDSNGSLADISGSGPIDLTVEATDEQTRLAPWLTDEWWATLIQHWANRSVSIHIAPTKSALLHPVVLHQLVMLRRVVPTWRLVGHAYVDDIITDEGVTDLAKSPYHEVRFQDRARSEPPPSNRCSWAPALEELIGRIRKAQMRLGTVTPILIRLPSGGGDARPKDGDKPSGTVAPPRSTADTDVGL